VSTTELHEIGLSAASRAATHLTRRAFEDDRRRDVALTLAGYRVVRFTWRQVTECPDEVARAVRGLLSAGPAG
jgi:very-short-patch-repair endonuclease